jgi:hypothetical protein
MRIASAVYDGHRPARYDPVTPPSRSRASLSLRKLNFVGGGDLADYLIYAGYTQRF